MAKKKILVLTDTMPWGHRSIAKAIYSHLKTKEKKLDIKVDYAEVKAETGVGGDMYVFMYRYSPLSNRILHKLAENPNLRDLFEAVTDYNLPNLKKCIGRYKPDLVICSYYYHSHTLARWREENNLGFKLWTVVADPWTINPVSYVKGADLHLIYDDVGIKEGRKLGIKDENMMKTGWWVREEMYQKYDKQKILKKWGITDDRPVVFVGGGSLGTNSITKLLPNLLMIQKKVAVVFNTGTDKLAYSMVEEFTKMFRRIRKDDMVKIINLGWIDNMAEVVGACDVVFGKAGPNFLFDVVACKKPFVAITHIGGQEDGNIDLIVKKKLGWVREKRNNAGKFLLEFLDNPKKYLSKFEKTIAEEAEKNRETWEIIDREI